MRRRDQYGTHDEIGRGPRGSNAARGAREDVGDPRGRTPNYGGGSEKRARTSHGGGAAFEGRDYEREEYGGGYGQQRETRDVPAAGRKGEWMHETRRSKPQWRGQAGGTGMDGLASERAFGTESNEQMSRSDSDGASRRRRASELRGDDEDRAPRRTQDERRDDNYRRGKDGRKRF